MTFVRAQAWLAQSVERWTLNPTVAGSSPALGSPFAFSLYFWYFYSEKKYKSKPLVNAPKA